VCGSDDYLVEQQARRIVEARVPAADRTLGLEVVDGRVDTGDAAVQAIRQCLEAVQTPGFFGSGKLVWLKNASFLNPQVRPGDSDLVKERLAGLTALIKGGIPDGQGLLISALTVARNTSFFKACQAAGEVSDFGSSDKAWELEKLARERLNGLLHEFRLQMTEEVRERFLQRVGASTRMMANELEKLRVYLGAAGERVAAADVDAIVSVGREAMAWDLTDAMGERNAPALVDALRRLEAQNENPIGLVTMAESRIRDLLVLRQAMDQHWLEVREGERGATCRWKEPLPAGADALLAALPRDPRSVAPFVQKKIAAQAVRYTLAELRRARLLLMELREKLVSSSTPPEALLEGALLRVVGWRKSAGPAVTR
jgi:DNA polymerase-3 subunit delta